MNREDLLCIDDNGLVKYQYTETEIKKMVDDECNDLFEEYKEDFFLITIIKFIIFIRFITNLAIISIFMLTSWLVSHN
jgi:hypothetical protein